MSVKVFIDGSSGTTGLRIADRLAARPDIELLSISAEGRKDVNERAKVINSADLAFLCLPDAASKEVMPLLRPDVKVLDTSTAFRTDAAWDYGFPELKGQKEKIKNSYRVAVPGCYASGFISIARPLVELGLARYLGRLLEGVMRPLFHVSGACASAFALGFVGGYPVGAKTAINLYERGMCTRTEAERLLAFCNNSGPAFILGVVGAGIFASSTVGVALYLAHALA